MKNLNLPSFIVFMFLNSFNHLKACSQAGVLSCDIPCFFNIVWGLHSFWQYLSVFLCPGKWNLSTALDIDAKYFVTSLRFAFLGFSLWGFKWHISSKNQALILTRVSLSKFPKNSIILPWTWLIDSLTKSSSTCGMIPQGLADSNQI